MIFVIFFVNFDGGFLCINFDGRFVCKNEKRNVGKGRKERKKIWWGERENNT
jgi:hypothetical protein